MICTFVRHDKTLVIFLLLVNKLYFIIILHNKDQLKSSHSVPVLYFIHHYMYNLRLELVWGGFLSACLLQIALKFIPVLTALVVKRWNVYLNAIVVCRLESSRLERVHSVAFNTFPSSLFAFYLIQFLLGFKWGWAATFVGWREIRKSHQQIQDIQRFGVIWSIRWCLFVANVLIKNCQVFVANNFGKHFL